MQEQLLNRDSSKHDDATNTKAGVERTEIGVQTKRKTFLFSLAFDCCFALLLSSTLRCLCSYNN